MRSQLSWVIPLIFTIIGIGAIFLGFNASKMERFDATDDFEEDASGFAEELAQEWENVDTYMTDCNELGITLREIEAKFEYSYRLFLVLPQVSKNGLILVSDGGKCWINGTPKTPTLWDADWFHAFFDYGAKPKEPMDFPISGVRGNWSILPVKNDMVLWGIMLVQHYQR